jgi:hypothetical protein
MEGADVDVKTAHLVGAEEVTEDHVLAGRRKRRRVRIVTEYRVLKGSFEAERQPPSGKSSQA